MQRSPLGSVFASRFPHENRSHLKLSQPGIGRKTAAELFGQRAQGGYDILHAARTRIVHRPAAERRVAGAEDHGAVDRVGIVDDALAKARDADIGHRQHQPVDHRSVTRGPVRATAPSRPCRPSRRKSPCRSYGRVRPWRPFRAASPASAAADRRTSCAACRRHRGRCRARPDRRARSAPSACRTLPRLRRSALVDLLVQHHDRFHHIGRQRAIDEEARRALHRQRQTVDRADERERLLQHLRILAVMADDLDQLHARDRIEKCRPRSAPAAPACKSSSGMLEVFVARIASGRILGSMPA